MLSESLRRRIEQLNREPVPQPNDLAVAGPIVERATIQESIKERHQLSDGEEVSTPCGSHWIVRRPIEQVWPQARISLNRYASANSTALGDLELEAMRNAGSQRWLLLDLETCGLSGSTIFLAGLIHSDKSGLVLSQLWARDYSEEMAILHSLWQIVRQCEILVTFNGKSFDWPQVHDRSTLHHLGRRTTGHDSHPVEVSLFEDVMTVDTPRPEPLHVDLLHHSRRRWRSQLPNCRLQTLERFICGRHRVGDLPGHEIPGVYHEYVRHGHSPEIDAILHHNALDLITLLQLAIVLIHPDPHRPSAR